MTAAQTSNDATNPTPKSKKTGRWWKITLAIVALLLLLLLLAPTILSTSPGKNFIVAQVNSRIPGKVAINSLSLGWFSGAKINGFLLTDPDGKQVIKADTLTTGLTTLDALTPSSLSLGHVKLRGASADIVTYDDGTNNLTRSLITPAPAAPPSATPPPAAPPSNQTISGSIDANIDTLTIRTPAMSLDKALATIKIGFDADLARGVVKITDDSLIEEHDIATNQGGGVRVAKGSVLSWQTDPIDFSANVDYDLAKLGALITPLLGQSGVGLKTEGKHTMKLHVHGPLTTGPGKWSKVAIDPTTLAWDTIEYSGFTFGKTALAISMKDGVITLDRTQIPANNGTLIVQGRMDFNQDPPAFVLEKSTIPYEVINGFAINSQVAGGWLRFLPMTWGASGKDANLLNITGQLRLEINDAYLPITMEGLKSKGSLNATINIDKLHTDAPIFHQMSSLLSGIPGFDKFEKATNMDGDIRDIHIIMKDGKISYDNFRLGSSWGNVTFAGNVGLDQSLAMNVTVGTKGFNLPIPLSLAGTTASPKLALSKDFANDLGKNLGGSLKNMEGGVKDLGKNLGDLFKKDKNK